MLENNLERNCDPTNIAVERAFGIDSFEINQIVNILIIFISQLNSQVSQKINWSGIFIQRTSELSDALV